MDNLAVQYQKLWCLVRHKTEELRVRTLRETDRVIASQLIGFWIVLTHAVKDAATFPAWLQQFPTISKGFEELEELVEAEEECQRYDCGLSEMEAKLEATRSIVMHAILGMYFIGKDGQCKYSDESLENTTVILQIINSHPETALMNAAVTAHLGKNAPTVSEGLALFASLSEEDDDEDYDEEDYDE